MTYKQITKNLISLCVVFFSIAKVSIAEGPYNATAIPAGLVIGPNGSTAFTLRVKSEDPNNFIPSTLNFCIRLNENCYPLSTDNSKFSKSTVLDIGNRAGGTAYENLKLSKQFTSAIQGAIQSLSQGESFPLQLEVSDLNGQVLASTDLFFYSGVKTKSFTLAGKNIKKNQRQRGKIKDRVSITAVSSERPSRSYRSPGGFNDNVCTGTSNVFNSYREFLDCTDNAIAACRQTDAFEKAFCIAERCGNTPDQFESFWRNLDGDTKFVGSQYYKNNFGSSGSGEDRFQVALNPCLYDGAGEFTTKFNSSGLVMGEPFPLGNAFLRLFHPAKTENVNLSRGEARLGFNNQTLVTIKRDDFGATTVPFTYQQEIFKSFNKTIEEASKVYWVDGVIPVYMVFRPQGVIGLEIQARVSPESRFLEVDFKAYSDFGTSADAGPARDGVGSLSIKGLLSLVQSEYSTSKYIALNANADGMLPNVSELSQLEYWPPKGGFGPICAQWFASSTTHPVYGQRCTTQVDFGPISSRAGTIIPSRDGRDRLIYYLDRSKGGDEGTLTPYPWRSPILDGF